MVESQMTSMIHVGNANFMNNLSALCSSSFELQPSMHKFVRLWSSTCDQKIHHINMAIIPTLINVKLSSPTTSSREDNHVCCQVTHACIIK